MIRGKYQTAAGFTLMEIMVAMVIFSVGLLGLAALQGMGLKGNGDAYLRSQAIVLADDISDRMRSNNNAASLAVYAGAASPPAVAASCEGAGANCATAAMAAFDVSQWLISVGGLPGGTASISAAGPPYLITISWTGRLGQSTYRVSVTP